MFGVSAKGANENPIGQFGTGLKYAIAVCLRHGLKITLYLNGWEYTFDVVQDSIRDKEFGFINMYGVSKFSDHPDTVIALPFTTELGKHWELWMAFRELYSNTIDEQGEVFPTDEFVPDVDDDETIFVIEGDEFVQILVDKADVFLSSSATKTANKIDIHEGESNVVYLKGIRVAEFEKPLMHKYDITDHAELTEDRTLKSVSSFEYKLSTGVAASDDEEFITKLVTAPETHHESNLNFRYLDNHVSETFLKVVKKLMKKAKDKLNPTVISLYETIAKAKREKATNKRKGFVVYLEMPDGVSDRDMKDFLLDGIKSAKGELHHEDPLVQLDLETIRINYANEKEDDDIPF